MKKDAATSLFLKADSAGEWEEGKKRLSLPISARTASSSDHVQNEGQERWIQALTHYVLPERHKLLMLVIGTRIDALEATLKGMIGAVSKIVQAAAAYANALTDARLKFVEMKQANLMPRGESKTKMGQKLTDAVGVIGKLKREMELMSNSFSMVGPISVTDESDAVLLCVIVVFGDKSSVDLMRVE